MQANAAATTTSAPAEGGGVGSAPALVTRGRQSRGIPALDGLRALAVLAVMLYHFGVAHARGGFLGVDVFFVLSGYLITGQLVTRWVAGGRVRLGVFWAARARRLLPGLGALLLGTTAAMLILDRMQLAMFRGDLLAAATYSSNWWYVFDHTSYFVASGRPPVLQHLWSLAVEEQFYLTWPVLIALVVVAVRNYETRRRCLLGLAVALALGSTLVMLVGSLRTGAPVTADPSRWYFGSDSHVMGLLTGAALALWRHGDGLGAARDVAKPPASPRATLAGVAALAVLVVVLSRTDQFSPWLYRGGFTAVGVVTAVVIAVASRPGVLARALSIPLLREIGLRSYALYLWHWPVACFTRPGIDVPLSQNADLLLRFGLTFLLAEASYRFVERPVREHGWRPYWAGLQSVRIGAVRARTALAFTTAGMLVGLMMPATAAQTEPDYAGGGTVYVSNPGQPGTVHVLGHPPTGSGRASGGASSGRLGATHRHMSIAGPPSARASHPESRHTHSSPHGGGSGQVGPPPGPPAGSHTGSSYTLAELREVNLAVYGDSVPLGAIADLAARFKSVRNDAVEGIQAWTLLPQLTANARAGVLDKDIVVLHTGDNGVIDRSELETALASLTRAAMVIVAVPYVPREWQADNYATIEAMAGRYPNVRLMPWDTWVRAHPGDVWSDGIHLTPQGASDYTTLVVNTALGR